jgi:hypothetical protein
MIVRVRGVKKARGKGRVYYYYRKTGARINAEPNTVEFAMEVERLDRTARSSPECNEKQRGTLGALIMTYRPHRSTPGSRIAQVLIMPRFSITLRQLTACR